MLHRGDDNFRAAFRIRKRIVMIEWNLQMFANQIQFI